MAKKLARKGDTTEALSILQQVGVDPEYREIWLTPIKFDSDGHSPDVERQMAISFEKNLRFLNLVNHDPIVIHLHSGGGYFEDGMAIFDSIALSESPTAMIVYGEASSASGIILQAADLRVMMPNSHLMVHSGSMAFEGSMEAVENAVKWSVKQTNSMIDIFTKRSKISREEILSRMSGKDWYMLPQEAVDNGFADAVLGSGGYESISKVKARTIERKA